MRKKLSAESELIIALCGLGIILLISFIYVLHRLGGV